jgi:hypothetical protein
MLRGGKRIFCIGADDNHAAGDTGGAWVMIKADRLEYRTITKALEEGNFYTSQGPEIHALYVEDGRIHVEADPCREIVFTTGNRNALRLRSTGGEPLRCGSFALEEGMGYVRVTVIGADGRCADSNAYFLDEIL